MVALLDEAGVGDGTSVVLGRHGGGNSTMGACASSPNTVLVTVQGDGVILYDCEAQVSCEKKPTRAQRDENVIHRVTHTSVSSTLHENTTVAPFVFSSLGSEEKNFFAAAAAAV